MQRKSCAHRVTKILIEALESRRLLSAGALDTSFAKDGVTSTTFDTNSVQGHGMAVQADGKIVEVGTASGGLLTLVRYNTDGTLDTTFGPLGTGKETKHVLTADLGNFGICVAIQPDGKIVVGGQAIGPEPGIDDYMIVCRFNSNGSFDNTFDHDGIVDFQGIQSHLTPEYARANAITFQKDGKIIIAGDESQGFFNNNDNLILIRLNKDGSVDQNFGIRGSVDFDHDDNEVAEAVTVDYNDTPATNPDYGKIIVVGHVFSGHEESDEIDGVISGTTFKALIARFTPNGQLDTSFNKTGYIDSKIGGTSPSVDVKGVVVESGGNIVVAGSEGTKSDSTDHKFFLAGITSSGAMNKTFGTNGTGTVTTSLGGNDLATSLVLGGFGQQLIAGGTHNDVFGLAAYNLDGTLDTGFGNGGKVTTGTDHFAFDVQVALAPNHTIVAAGGNDFNTARYIDAGPNVSVSSIDPTAGPTIHHGGIFSGPVPNPASMIVARDEKLNVATRVFFTVNGSAIAPSPTNLKRGIENYTLSGMTIEPAPGNAKVFTAYVDIPAGQTFTTVTFTPNIIPAATTTATFAIQTNVNYQTSLPASQTITLLGTNPTTPVATTLTATADTYIQDGSSADTNFGTATQLLVKKSSTTGQNRETYLKFDLSSLSTAASVKLNLFGALNNTDSPSLVTQVFSIADNSWLETGITWNKRRTPGATALASATITGTTPALYTFDVTAYVKAQLAAGNKTVSFVLINSANSSPAVIFNSREAGSNKPTLTIT
jgi:uncharacterized delta-60 repeat protein